MSKSPVSKKEPEMTLATTVFNPLDGNEFEDRAELETRILTLFNDNIERFPPEYTYRSLLELGERKGWIHRDGDRILVRYKPESHPLVSGAEIPSGGATSVRT